MAVIFVDITPNVFVKKPAYVTKYVLPLVFSLLPEQKSDIKNANVKLVQTLYRHMGNSLLESASTIPQKNYEILVQLCMSEKTVS